MGIEHLNRWHWLIIGAIVGCLLGYSWASASETIDEVSSSRLYEFERDVIQQVEGRPLVKGIVIHPPEWSGADQSQVNLVTYKRLARDRQGNYWWIDKRTVAKIPYVPELKGRATVTPGMTIEGYLGELAKQHDFIRFSNGWYLNPMNSMMLGSGAGIVVLGLIWPTLLGLMTGAGLGPKPKPKKDIPLWKVKSTPTKAAMAPVVSAADQARLDAVNDAYEQSLTEIAMTMPAAPVEEKKSPAEVRKLNTTSVEEVKPIAGENPDDLEAKGEYYPAFFHKKADEDPSHKPKKE